MEKKTANELDAIKKKKSFRWGVSYKLALLVALAGVMPVFIIGGIIYVNIRTYSIVDAERKLGTSIKVADELVTETIHSLAEHIVLLKNELENSPDVRALLQEPATEHDNTSKLQEIMNSDTLDGHRIYGFSRLYLVDKYGVVRGSTDEDQKNLSPDDLDNFTAGEKIHIDPRHDIHLSARKGLNGSSFTIHLPLFVDNEGINEKIFLAGDISQAHVADFLESSLSSGIQSRVYLVSPEGEIRVDTHNGLSGVSHSHEDMSFDHEDMLLEYEENIVSQAWKDKIPLISEGGTVLEYEKSTGEAIIAIYQWSPDTHSWIVADIEKKDALKFLSNTTLFFVLGFSVLILVGGLFFLFATRIIANPLKDLTKYVLSVDKKEGDTSFVPMKVSSADEIGELAAAFNAMMERIRESHEYLEKTVKEKTSELSIKLKEIEKNSETLKKTKTATLNVLEDAVEIKNRMEIQRNELQAIISSIGEGLILVDKDYTIVLVNPVAEKILGVGPRDLIGKKAYDSVVILKDGKEIPREERPIAKVLATGEPVSVTLNDNCSFRIDSGKEFPVAIFVTPILRDGVTGVVVVFRDISEDKALDESKSSFISIASHQLRTPLTSIRWYSEMLLTEEAGPLNKDQKDFAFEINDGTLRLYNTIDLLLMLSRVEKGTVKNNPEPLNFGTLARDVASELKPQIEQKNLSLILNLPDQGIPDVVIDPLLARQVVLNLIANAIRYTNDVGTIEVRIEPTDSGLTFVVRDNGIGIPVAERPKIFSKFFRAQNALQKVPDGSGLGLSLVKGLVEAWGGKVWFESEEGKSTTFYFTVPRQPLVSGPPKTS